MNNNILEGIRVQTYTVMQKQRLTTKRLAEMVGISHSVLRLFLSKHRSDIGTPMAILFWLVSNNHMETQTKEFRRARKKNFHTATDNKGVPPLEKS